MTSTTPSGRIPRSFISPPSRGRRRCRTACSFSNPCGSGHEVTLFTRPRSPRDAGPSGAEFYSDRQHGEFWVGRRRTLRETADALGVEAAARDGLERALGGGVPTRVVRGTDAFVDALVPPSAPAEAELLSFLSELRLVKDAWAIEQLRAAVGHTVMRLPGRRR